MDWSDFSGNWINVNARITGVNHSLFTNSGYRVACQDVDELPKGQKDLDFVAQDFNRFLRVKELLRNPSVYLSVIDRWQHYQRV